MSTIISCLSILLSPFIFIALLKTPYDISDVTMALFCMMGVASFFAEFSKGRFKVAHIASIAVIAFVFFRGALDCVPGYTGYEIAKIVAWIGIMFLVSNSNRTLVLRCLLVCSLSHLLLAYFNPIEWQIGSDPHRGSWGIVRHAIIYSTIIFAGIACAYEIIKKDKSTAWKALGWIFLLTGIIAIFPAYSNTVIAVTAIWVLCVALLEKQKKLFFVVLGIFIALSIYVKPEGFQLDVGRKDYYMAALDGVFDSFKSFAIGHGPGSWQLFSGILGFPNIGHPHNELLDIAFNYGIIGTLVFACFAMFLFARAGITNIGISLFLLLVSTLTNSIRYPHLLLLTSVFAGIALSQDPKTFETELIVFDKIARNACLTIVFILSTFLIKESYDHYRSDLLLSEMKNQTPYNRYIGLHAGRTLETRYYQHFACFAYIGGLRDVGPEMVRAARHSYYELKRLQKFAPGYKDMNNSMYALDSIVAEATE